MKFISELLNESLICSELTVEDKQMGLELRLDYIREEVYKLHSSIQNKIVKNNNTEIVLECPSVQRLLNQTEEEHLVFIKKIIFTNQSSKQKIATIETNKQAQLFVEKISPKLFIEINERIRSIMAEFLNNNFLARYKLEQQLIFLPSIESLLWFVKLIFNESLSTFYDNLFCLSHYGHMNLTYVEDCTVGEYKLFASQLQKVIAANAPSTEQQEEVVSDEEAGFFDEPV